MSDTTTDLEQAAAADLVPAGPGQNIDGLEEVEQRDLAMPILRIDHTEATFVNSLTNEVDPELLVIMLGLTKQRILWPLDPGEPGERPLCRSYEHKHGIPNPDKWDRVVLQASKFTREQIEQAESLPCESCNLKEWGTHPKTGGAWCNEQYTFPLLVIREGAAPAPAVISFVRTGIKPCRNYVSGFIQNNKPLYTAMTKMTLQAQRKGSVDYAVPRFTKLDETDPGNWPKYSEAFHAIRDYLQTPRTRDDSADTTTTTDTATDTSTPVPPKRAQPAKAAPAPTRPVDEDEEPF